MTFLHAFWITNDYGGSKKYQRCFHLSLRSYENSFALDSPQQILNICFTTLGRLATLPGGEHFLGISMRFDLNRLATLFSYTASQPASQPASKLQQPKSSNQQQASYAKAKLLYFHPTHQCFHPSPTNHVFKTRHLLMKLEQIGFRV